MIDTHAHYDDRRFDSDRHEIINAVKTGGVEKIINAGATIKSSRASLDLADKYDFIYATVGVHPNAAEETPEDTIEILAGLLKNKKAVAIGEIGLDYYRNFSSRESQRYWFKKQMDFAADMKYPAVIHDRDAHGECLETAKQYSGRLSAGVFHCFSGSVEMAGELVKLGYMMSFGGVVTFANAKTSIEVIKSIPPDYIMLETDCPYLAPHPHRGKRNDSGYLPFIAQKIAEIKNIDVEKVIAVTTENAKRCFGV